MKIVVIDDIQFEHNQFDQLQKLAQVVVHSDKPKDEAEAIIRSRDATIIVTNTTPITRSVMNAAPKLKMIAAAATGAEAVVDISEAFKRNITVTNIPAYATESVAELAIALMINLNRNILPADQSVRHGNSAFQPFLGTELKGKTLGIIGLGRIGKRVATIAHTLGMRVLACDIRPKHVQNVKIISLKKLLKTSDIITVHCDLNSTSKNLLGASEFSLMKPNVMLINTAREEIVNEKALRRALHTHTIGGLALELNILRKNVKNHWALSERNVILTPHIGFFTKEALKKRKQILTNNIVQFMKGNPVNVFNQE